MALPEAQLARIGERWQATTIAGCVLWVSPDAVTVENDGTVSRMFDKSGNGNDLYQFSAANRPTYVYNSAAQNPMLDCTKLHWMERSATFGQTLNNFPFSQSPCTIFYVSTRRNTTDANSNTGTVGWYGAVGTPHIEMSFDATTAAHLTRLNSSPSNTSGFTALPAGTPYLWVMSYGPNDVRRYRNGDADLNYSDNSFTTSTAPIFRYGLQNDAAQATITVSSRGFDGQLGDLIIYNRVLSILEKNRVVTELCAYYDLHSSIIYF